MHLHLGLDATGLPPDLEIHHIRRAIRCRHASHAKRLASPAAMAQAGWLASWLASLLASWLASWLAVTRRGLARLIVRLMARLMTRCESAELAAFSVGCGFGIGIGFAQAQACAERASPALPSLYPSACLALLLRLRLRCFRLPRPRAHPRPPAPGPRSVEDWGRGVTSEQNLVLVSIPSQLCPQMAPKGKAVVHAYTCAPLGLGV